MLGFVWCARQAEAYGDFMQTQANMIHVLLLRHKSVFVCLIVWSEVTRQIKIGVVLGVSGQQLDTNEMQTG